MQSALAVEPLTQIETLLPLTRDEARRLKECESVIERGLKTFYTVGNALAEIRESRLYRISYSTFEDYCRERWQMSRFYAHRLIDAAQVVENLLPMGNVPNSERQARELAPYEPEVQQAVWHIALSTAPIDSDGNPTLTAAHIRSVANVLTEVVKGGGMDDGSGEMKPLGTLIDAAVTEETYERMMRQKEYIREKLDTKDDDDNERKHRQKSDRSEVEVLYEPEIQNRLGRYIETITEFENMEWPPELGYLLRMFQLHKAHANFQKTRNVDDDCEMALSVLRRLTPDAEIGFEIAAQEHYDWLFDLGYCMSKKEYTSRLKRMSGSDVRMALLTDAGDDGKQDDRRGVLPGIVCIPWRKVWDQSSKRPKDEDED
jgi:hypothetical protein